MPHRRAVSELEPSWWGIKPLSGLDLAGDLQPMSGRAAPTPRQPTLGLTTRASSTGGGEFLDGPDQVVAPPAGEAIGPEAERLVGIGESGAPE